MKNTIFFILFLFLFVSTSNASEYHVATDGSGDFTTIAQVNAATFLPGDSILFKRGDTWREQLVPDTGSASGYITYGAYGTGNKPLLLGSINLFNTSFWYDNGDNVWSDNAGNGVEILSNPSFDSDTTGWSLYATGSCNTTGSGRTTVSGEYDTASGGYKLVAVTGGVSMTDIQLYQNNLTVENNTWYKVGFKAKADSNYTIGRVTLIKSTSPYNEYFSSYYTRTPTIGTDWDEYNTYFKSNIASNDARLDFFVGTMSNGTTLYIDTLSFQKLSNQDKPLHDTGNLIFNNEENCGLKILTGITDVDDQGDYYVNSANVIYLYSASNPASFYTNIEAAIDHDQTFISVDSLSYVKFENLDIRYNGGNTFNGKNTSNLIFDNLTMSWIGGGILSGSTRYGNAIQFWNNATNNIIQNCYFNQVYDEAFTNQGSAGSQTNIVYKNNIYSNCWFGMSSSIGTQNNITLEHNTCINPSQSWSANQRTSGLGAESPARCAMFSDPATTQSTIKNNIFYDNGTNANSHLVHLNYANLSTTDMDYNCYYKPNNAMLRQQNTNYTQVQFYNWKTASSKDAHSISSDPLLTSSYRLKPGSPCINAGVDVDVDTDYFGHKRTGTPDIGAVEAGTYLGKGTYGKGTWN